EPQPLRYRREMGDEQVRRRAEAETEMMLAEENALEAEFLGAAPQIEMPAIALGGLGGAGVSAAHRRAEQLENPRLDHRRAAAPTPRLNPPRIYGTARISAARPTCRRAAHRASPCA